MKGAAQLRTTARRTITMAHSRTWIRRQIGFGTLDSVGGYWISTGRMIRLQTLQMSLHGRFLLVRGLNQLAQRAIELFCAMTELTVGR